MTENKDEEEEKKVSVTIRGIDKDLYERISRKAKELNITVGTAINEAMRDFLSALDAGLEIFQKSTDKALTSIRTALPAQQTSIIIKDIGEIRITANDLMKADRPILLLNVKKIVFTDDVTENIFREKIRSIKIAEEVVIPKGISMITVAQKCQMVKKITQA
ncbi:MAG: hypothetical protein QW333_01560 [Fervidicoccaceae archaeon]